LSSFLAVKEGRCHLSFNHVLL